MSFDDVMQRYDELHYYCNGNMNQEQQLVAAVSDIMNEVIRELPNDKVIALRPLGDTTRWLIDKFDFGGRDVVCVDKSNEQQEYNGIRVIQPDILNYDEVYVINTSFVWRDEINQELSAAGAHYADLYQLYENKGLKLRTIPKLYRETTHTILNHYYGEFMYNKSNENLRKLLTACVEAFDFVLLEKMCREYSDCRGVSEIYNKYQQLVMSMKMAVEERRMYKDIWIYWMDAVPFKWRKKLPFIERLSNEALSFENVYTTTPYTSQTFKAMFGKLMALDDVEEAISPLNENSEGFRYLSEKGYDFCNLGYSSVNPSDLMCDAKYLDNMDVNVSCNYVYWKTFCRMISSSKPVFYIAHTIVETHPPMLCSILKEYNWHIGSQDYNKQIDISYEYIDERVRYWVTMLEQQTQIILSDHGEHISRCPDRMWSQRKIHTWCMVLDKDLERKKEYGLFSYINLLELVKYILGDGIRYEELLSKYVSFQDTDFYGEKSVEWAKKNGFEDWFVAGRGAFDGICKYAINGLKHQFFYKVENDEDIEVDYSEHRDEFEKLKEIAGTTFPDVSRLPKFRDSKRLYE